MATQQESNTKILAELYKYAPSALVELFELDLSPLDGYYTFPTEDDKHFYYVSGVNPKAVDTRENVFRYSEDLTQTTWIKSGYTVSGETITGTGYITATLDKPLTTGEAYTVSAFVKKNTTNNFAIFFDKTYWNTRGVDSSTVFDLVNGKVLGSNNLGSGIIDAGDGWYRVYATEVPTDSSGAGVQLAKSASASSYHIKMIQIEKLGGVGRYTKTEAVSIPYTTIPDLYTTWKGKQYKPCPILLEGIETTSAGQLPSPTLSIYDVNGEVFNLCKQFDGLSGANIIRRRTFVKFLDTVNFPGNLNPTADPQAGFPEDVFRIDRLSESSPGSLTFELGTSWDIEGVKLPRRTIMANTCPWEYKKDGCTWVPIAGRYYDAYDNPVQNANEDACGKMLSSCRLRFGDRILPYGGFISAGVYGKPL